jgi:hypothetical protein
MKPRRPPTLPDLLVRIGRYGYRVDIGYRVGETLVILRGENLLAPPVARFTDPVPEEAARAALRWARNRQ